MATANRDSTVPRSPRDTLALRAATLRAIRAFFDARGFLEVETPVRIRAPALELHIDAVPASGAWLRTSPELHMKRLLAEGRERIYQVGPCFRHGERGRLHNPEFTMLEWYRLHADSRDLLNDTVDLLRAIARDVLGATRWSAGGRDIDVGAPCDERSVPDLYRELAGWDPAACFDADRFDMDMVQVIEPALPRGRLVVLKDYPAPVAALARLNPLRPAVAERWELYVDGIELANAFAELTDPVEQRARFLECAEQRRAMGKAVYPLDEAFLGALERGLPPCAGIALGVDRLVMLLAGAPSLDEVRPFRDEA